MSNLKNKYNCSMELTMDLIGGKWKIRILWYLNMGTKRFSEIKRLIPDITPKMLTTQLREMENDDLITRKVYPQVPPKVEYSITKYGSSLQNTLDEMCKWGTTYANNHDIKL
ncbi:winged helix-turn-helix transcriptional regulator [Clostridium algidicarnis]|uniref:HxlR family transcriptional regulator n=2 Tax=Clostridium algidicarnis TaxID=37659 RepID=A0A2S6FUM8_9CLOT|nr:helix-turn-helix domain-containing protein [Clostridium algidicarnis]MBU3220945.1 helix-turn-helix transcriptional regulator [Clostridium algidicarnis]PPK44138.1 HxlR family transcriptional regulator [Clostridium algidicarnis DSM 15099]